MASVELILAAVAAADLCLKYGKRLINAYETFKTADDAVQAKVLLVKAIWARTTSQIEFFKRVAKTLEPAHCGIHFEVLQMLQVKLSAAATKIESVIKTETAADGVATVSVKKMKYLFYRDDIESVLSDLEHWQRVFDPTWFLILRMGDKTIDNELSKTPASLPLSPTLNTSATFASIASSSSTTSFSSMTETLRPLTRQVSLTPTQKFRRSLQGGSAHVSLSEEGLDWAVASAVAHSTTTIVPRADPKKQRSYAVDTINCEPDLDVARTRADAETLAKKLAQVDPATFGLLSCHGLVKRKDKVTRQLTSLNLVFHLPDKNSAAQPVSLRHHLLYGSGFSLSKILGIARQLAGAVSFVHTCDFVHKNIRPEAVLVFPESDAASASSALGSAYLLGFDSFRSVNFNTLRTGDATWQSNLYRHPSRQGVFAQDAYGMQHDVYALGVCLLELGLWTSFVRYEKEGEENNSDGDGSEVLPSDGLGLVLDDFAFMANQSMQHSSPKIKDHLIAMARSKLPERMGDKYTAVVITCLTCLDPGNEDFGDEEDMKDDDGILVGVRFIERVLLKLSDISF